ncbi:type II secretion system major pseudopilin GspG [Aliiroseovarius crassostreae]|uniref:type II secretion system major pseudopilin GspG n=1 Tax=Aliiroseovarius crassostreae TaxID=154981 RepID=UPI0021AECCC1|nr:type II secretion system major pseudopilin GspG [Aliiroseovarius crassostreae]UWP90896.1 type II secretion system major pseudopilin GspG [Aliiroseovarius crassostreae]
MQIGNHFKSRLKDDAGFTLMELLVVLVIIGLLAGLVGPLLYNKINPAKQTIARGQIGNFTTALESFWVDTGQFPSTQQGLAVLRENPGISGWNGPYLRKNIPLDPWGNPYVYLYPGRDGHFEILSYGADGVEGGTGENQDLTSWSN